jgi:hypothetical protein
MDRNGSGCARPQTSACADSRGHVVKFCSLSTPWDHLCHDFHTNGRGGEYHDSYDWKVIRSQLMSSLKLPSNGGGEVLEQ